MGLDQSPKKFAQDVSQGLVTINRMMLKRYTPVEIQKISSALISVQKETRTAAVEPGDYDALRDKGTKAQRINGALMVLRTYAKENKFTLPAG